MKRAAHWALRPKTIKEMVVRLLEEAHPSGLTALEILAGIQKRWMPTLERTSLSPQLSRLKNDHLIENRLGKWFPLVSGYGGVQNETEAPATTGAPEADDSGVAG